MSVVKKICRCCRPRTLASEARANIGCDKKAQQSAQLIETENVVTPPSKVSSPTDVKVSQDDESDKELSAGSVVGDNASALTPRPVGASAAQPRAPASFAIPDGLAMDPLMPTALAVSNEFMDRIGSGLSLLRGHGKKVQKYVWKNRKIDILRRSWKSVVTVVLVDAAGLPDSPASSSNHVYAKFTLGTESHKSKSVTKTSKPTWRERFNLYMYEDSNLEITMWHKGKQKNFMGRCVIDLSKLEKEKTHDLRQELECGFGSVHMLVTLSGTSRPLALDRIPTTNGVQLVIPDEQKFAWYRLDNDWTVVGQLSVVVHGAKGLPSLGISGKADAYCVLELDNSRVQTHTVRCCTETNWNKSYVFPVSDVTSTLDITVYDESMLSANKQGENLGRLSVPLLRINNEEKRWYALKDRSKKSSAKGNCPRILLEMAIAWNPVKASLRVFNPKETKYVQKPPKFNIPLIYSNLEFIKNVFNALYTTNECAKRLFEWESREKSAVALAGWLTFWYFFRIWMTPLILMMPFLYHWSGRQSCNNTALVPSYQVDEEFDEDEFETQKDDKTLKNRINGLQDLTFTIKNGIDYLVSLAERIVNLSNFTVPYLSYLVMLVLAALAAVLYVVPANYLLMAIGVYKFSRKLMNPKRVPNNDILDFFSRVPDNQIVKEWRELKVPEPNLSRAGSIKRVRTLTS